MRLMDQYPDFHYTHTQPYVYETLEKYHPDLFAELKEKIDTALQVMIDNGVIDYLILKHSGAII